MSIWTIRHIAAHVAHREAAPAKAAVVDLTETWCVNDDIIFKDMLREPEARRHLNKTIAGIRHDQTHLKIELKRVLVVQS